MANFEILNFKQSWILSKYSKFLQKSDNQSDWQTLDGSDFGTPLMLFITPTNFLLIKFDNEIQEFINLWSNSSNLKGIYKGNSLLIMHKMKLIQKDFLRKFRVQFLDSKSKNGNENCLDCVKELQRYFEIVCYDQANNCDQNNNKKSQKSDVSSKGSKKDKEPVLVIPDSNNLIPSSQPRTGEIDSVNLKDLTKILIEKNEHKLPLFYQKSSESELLDSNEENAFQEFTVCCLLDPTFPTFVSKVENILSKILNDEKAD